MALNNCNVTTHARLIILSTSLLGHGVMGAETSLQAATGLGYDSNAYHSPAEAYIDFAQTGTPLVAPNVQSGFFVPVDLHASVDFTLWDNARLSSSYSFEGASYQDNALENANQKTHRIKGRLTHSIALQENAEATMFAGVKFTDQVKTYIDRDTGAEKQSGSRDVSNRYEYQGIAVEGGLRAKFSAWRLGVDGLFEQKDYVDPVIVSQYDNDYYRVSADMEHALGAWNHVYGEISLSRREYGDRPARNAQGQLFSSNPKREYAYQSAKVGWRSEPHKAATVQVDLRKSKREDKFVGYGDYDETAVDVGILLKPMRRIKARVSGGYWTRDYPNAFAFDEPTRGASNSEGWDGQCKLDWRWRKNIAWNALLKYEKDTGSDQRYQFERSVLTVGVEYTM